MPLQEADAHLGGGRVVGQHGLGLQRRDSGSDAWNGGNPAQNVFAKSRGTGIRAGHDRCALPEASAKTVVIESRVPEIAILIARITATPRTTPNMVSRCALVAHGET